jgi:hypothetical protein
MWGSTSTAPPPPINPVERTPIPQPSSLFPAHRTQTKTKAGRNRREKVLCIVRKQGVKLRGTKSEGLLEKESEGGRGGEGGGA